eukprot:TRINITY_DN2166_c0_g1_i1.p1 TRINITY_DN2166_c0_g1~~TRINITY_DN2166_c0_g1_i1.p1  ORF type:complete len:203 (-),score=14.27 TRINITY_DN2166_c0_g1_i1:277-885(-)
MENRKTNRLLARSTGSFAYGDHRGHHESLVIPTPTRKMTSLHSSPSLERRDPSVRGEKRKNSEDVLFAAAGNEITNILFQRPEESNTKSEEIVNIPPRNSNALSFPAKILSQIIQTPAPTPPIRSSNPLICNTAFKPAEIFSRFSRKSVKTKDEKIPPKTAVPSLANQSETNATESRTETRNRSLSWPNFQKPASRFFKVAS